MGRKTFESIGRPLPGRPNLIVSRNPGFSADGIEVFGSLDSVIDAVKSRGAEELIVIGGAAVYAEVLNSVNRIYLTEVHAKISGDVSFPDINTFDWCEISRERQVADEKDDHDYSLVVLERVETQ
ncbi:MAG: Dihydrofolate reductase type 3 [Alphaproteobacteria bacterium MarineAlpha11_Bin1]|nr:MAG: Dihydrofolate reductase type 3 [Alphaproteobacteria bacterium MarineAlpha11_Bin1]|tara:strand:- start:671 stop:1045 length:375 start_codon:yes stop_codon:yes gene_type:complete